MMNLLKNLKSFMLWTFSMMHVIYIYNQYVLKYFFFLFCNTEKCLKETSSKIQMTQHNTSIMQCILYIRKSFFRKTKNIKIL